MELFLLVFFLFLIFLATRHPAEYIYTLDELGL